MEVLEKKKFKEICQFGLNLPIKISYIPDFEKNLSRGSKVMAKKKIFLFITRPFFVLEKKFTLAIPPKLAKIIESVKQTYSLKLIFDHFLTLQILYKLFDLCVFCWCQKVVNSILEKKFTSQTPIIFISFREINTKTKFFWP